MRIKELKIPGAFHIEPEPMCDDRGFFMRTFDRDTFRYYDMNTLVRQQSISYNTREGTLRGMHYQEAPYEEEKYVSCIKGAVYDVLLDLRPASPQYGKWESVHLAEVTGNMVYVPRGVAHGFQTLMNNSVVHYDITANHEPLASRGVSYNDPAFDIKWPAEVTSISIKDRNWPLWS